jgi:hypothetical protein
MMKMVRNKEITKSYDIVCKHLIPHEENHYKLVLEVYSGFMRYRTRIGMFNEMITLKCYGIKAILTCSKQTPLEINFGFLTPDYTQVAYLADAFKVTQIQSIQHLRESIRSEAATWGEPVFDINGLAVPNVEFGFQKRDPFIQSAKRILADMLKAAKRFRELGKSGSKGVDI